MTTVTNEQDYKYEVAFSFLSEDETLAHQIDDLLKDRLRTFIYTRRQEEIAGTDGEVTLNRVFSSGARTVVVLYRARWGETPFTRVEETAIRNRAHDEGYDFCIFVPLEEQAEVPRWLPKSRIWPNLARWGKDGLAAVIEARTGELGGDVQEETASHRAARLGRELERERERQSFLGSRQAVDVAKTQFAALSADVNRLTGELHATSPTLELAFDAGKMAFALRGSGASIIVAWQHPNDSAESLRDAHLILWLYSGNLKPELSGWSGKVSRLSEIKMLFDRDPSAVLGWRDVASGRFFTIRPLADECLKMWVEQIRSTRLR